MSKGGDNRDANDGSSNNVMHFRSVLKLYKILPSTRRLSRKRELLLCRLSMLHFLFKRRIAMSRSPRYPPRSARISWTYEPGLHLSAINGSGRERLYFYVKQRQRANAFVLDPAHR